MKLTAFAQLYLAVLPVLAQKDDLYTQAGSHVIFSYPGLVPPPKLFNLTRQGKVGGIILFGENVDENLGNVAEEFQTAYAESPAYSGDPLLILTDQEGGTVRRLPGGPEPSAKKVGQMPDRISEATRTGKVAADVLAASNVNGNLAPVLDVYRTADNFLDRAERSYSNDTSVVSDCSSAFIVAQQDAGVIATAKHFPGLGPAGNENTDLQPVTIDTPLDDLRSIDEKPYISAISAGVDMVMTSWAVYPTLDSEKPAGLSKAWVQGELRDRLGFDGVTITDALEAGGLEAFGDAANRGLLACQAGMDLLLASGRNVTQGEVVLDALVQGLEDGTLPKRAFDEGTKRIRDLQSKLTF